MAGQKTAGEENKDDTMTLSRQLAVYLTLLLLLLFSGSLVLNVTDARNYLQVQLESHAQDTATSLGVAIAATEPGNIAAIDSTVDAVFDRGYYRIIRFTDTSGKVLIHSEHELALDDVPLWFMGMVNLKSPEVSTEVNNGWLQVGTLHVASHPGYAYRSLWSKTRNGIVLFGAGLLLAIVGLNLFLGIALRPLKRLEEQAEAICDRRFEQQEKLPRTRDLRRVVEAMNRMAGKLEHLFNEKVILTEELRRQSVKDPLTGLFNRRAFDDRVASSLQSLESADAGGSLLVIQISGLDDFNKEHGRNAADLLLVDIARRLVLSVQSLPQAFVGRRNGSEFTIFLPACDLEQGKVIAEGCFRSLGSMPYFISDEGSDRLHLALVTHMGRIDLADIVNEAEQLLSAVQRKGTNNWEVRQINSDDNLPYRHWSEAHWQESLRQVLRGQELELFSQPVVDTEGNLLFKEVFTRLRLLGELASAEAFLPMVERFDLHADFDKVVLEVLLARMKKADSNERFCINLSPRSLQDQDFYHWLLDTLMAVPELCPRIVLEVPERTMLLLGENLDTIVTELVKTGCRFSVDHFGIASRTLTNLQSLELDYIKVDGSFVRGICDNQGNQFYIRTLAMLAKSRDIMLLAQDVENAQDWEQLCHLGVQGGQGFHIGRPERL
ncbi:MAG: bifunctional diguanylate cyclase/phosphodiesterase [Endozoicomonas sp.]